MTSVVLGTRNCSWWQLQLARTLAMGPVPNHMAFILDGNRRWARERGYEVTKGHVEGANSGEKMLRFLHAVGVKEFTLYLFSIENFRRAQTEVNFLMENLEKSIDDILERKPKACFRFVGNVKLLPEVVQKKIQLLEDKFKDYKDTIVNMAVAYTCRDDITQAIKKVVMKWDTISEELLEEMMYTREMSPVDILVRTSGETRLSDFLMYEVRGIFHIFYCYSN